MSRKYCTYLTIYRGNKLPPFYIGRSNTDNIKKGYRGSVSSKEYKQTWASEQINNPHLFKTVILTTHYTQQEAAMQEEFFHQALQVHKNPLYINRATSKGTFYADISGNKNPFFGSSRKGNKNPMYGKQHSPDTIAKMKRNGKGKNSGPKSASHKQAIREALQGRSYTDIHGAEAAEKIKAKLRKPRTDEQKARMKAAQSNRPRYNCIHCGTECGATNLARWHNDNCKHYLK